MLIEGLYTVTRTGLEGDRITATVHLNEHHAVFKGHFPNKPVMPGVCSLQIVQELLEQHLGRRLRLTKASNIKFMALIDPRVDPDLDFDLTQTPLENGVKVNAKVHFKNTLAVKLSAEFQEV